MLLHRTRSKHRKHRRFWASKQAQTFQNPPPKMCCFASHIFGLVCHWVGLLRCLKPSTWGKTPNKHHPYVAPPFAKQAGNYRAGGSERARRLARLSGYLVVPGPYSRGRWVHPKARAYPAPRGHGSSEPGPHGELKSGGTRKAVLPNHCDGSSSAVPSGSGGPPMQ